MIATESSSSSSSATDVLHVTFLVLLPRLEWQAGIFFRDIRCPDTKADKICEMVALAWKWFVRLHEVGKDVNEFAVVFAAFAAKAVRSGRRLCGQENSKDVMSSVAQRRRGFTVESLPSSTCTSQEQRYAQPQGQEMQDAFEERLQDNTQTPVPEQVAFRLDWPKYFCSLTQRDRKMAEYLSLGHSAKSAASKFGVSPGRVTQLRQRWCREWLRFQDDAPVAVGDAV